MAIITAIALNLGTAWAHSLEEVEGSLHERNIYAQFVQSAAPPFTLESAHGGAVSLSDYAGKVVVLSFIYTNCPDVCPLHTAMIAGVQADINRTAMADLVQFVSITTDPERDTPEALRDYAENQGVDLANWTYLTDATGKPEATRAIAKTYGLKFTPGDGGYLLHGVVTNIIDKSGNLRARYHGLKFDPTNLILYINALTNDNH